MVVALKEDLRREFLRRRLAMNSAEVERLSLKVQERFLSTEEYRRSENIALYCGFKNEVLTDLVFSVAKRDGKRLYYPRVAEDGLVFHLVESLEELSPGSHDIPEPNKENRSIGVDKLHCIVVPGVVFDINGARLGYGKGYYDRILKSTEALKVAFAFDFQVVQFIPLESWDVRMDCIVTEKKIIRI